MKWICDCGLPLKPVSSMMGDCPACGLVYPQLTATTPEEALREDPRMLDALAAAFEGKGLKSVLEILGRPYGYYEVEK